MRILQRSFFMLLFASAILSMSSIFPCYAIGKSTSETSTKQNIPFPKFDQSLTRHPEKQYRFNQIYKFPTSQKKVIEFRKAKKYLEALYDKNVMFLNYDKNSHPRIPKIVHQIWLGSPVPEKFSSWMATWANMQGWEYKLWTDKDAEEFPLYNRKLFDNAKNYGEKADILRYEILYQEGGVYVDVDFENINTELFNLLNRSFDFYAGLEPMEHRQPVNSPLIGNALIGSVAGHPFLEKIITDMAVHYDQHEDEWAVVSTGPVYITMKLHEYDPLKDTHFINVILPTTFFFPLTFSEIRDNFIGNSKKFVKPETGAIHYWTGSWLEEGSELLPKPKPKLKPAIKRRKK